MSRVDLTVRTSAGTDTYRDVTYTVRGGYLVITDARGFTTRVHNADYRSYSATVRR